MASNPPVSYLHHVHEASQDAGRLEALYREAIRDGKADLFAEAVTAAREQRPEELLFVAWYHRLTQPIATVEGATAWGWAVPLALLNGLLWWGLAAAFEHLNHSARFLSLVAMATLPAGLVLLYLALAGRRAWQRVAFLAAALALVAVFAHAILPSVQRRDFQDQYEVLTLIHLPLLSWATIGLYLCWQCWANANRFAYLAKSLETAIVGTLLGAALVVFAGITYGLFGALRIDLPQIVGQLFAVGGAGIIVVLTFAIVYDPDRAPASQHFDRGLSAFIATLMRVLLLPTLAVLLVYVAIIPFNFMGPFENRDVLIIYNAMQLAVIGLLIGAAPARDRDVSERLAAWLRRGIIALAVLALLVSLYAFSALLYRTATAVWTPNRLAFLGWNVIGIGTLGWLLVKQVSANDQTWLVGLKETLAAGVAAAVAWALLVTIGLPWFFGAAGHVAAAIG